MFEQQIARGVELLDQELGPNWPERIDLKRLDMRYGHDGVVGQLYGHLLDRFEPEEGIPYGFDIYLTEYDSGKRVIQTQEWKAKIIQLIVERGLKNTTYMNKSVVVQEEQISQAGHIVRLIINEEKEEYNVFVITNIQRVHLGFDNVKDARKLYEVLQSLDGMNAQCRFCEQEIQEMKKGQSDD